MAATRAEWCGSRHAALRQFRQRRAARPGQPRSGHGAFRHPRGCATGVGYPIRPRKPDARPVVTALACLCTCPDAAVAARIAEALVDERLAACVNVLPAVGSVYRWDGRVERAEEVLLVIKTVRARLEALTARVLELHPYELPEVIAVDIAGGLPAYLAWIADATRPGADA